MAFLPSEKKMKKERLKGKLLAHHPDRRTLHQRLREKKRKEFTLPMQDLSLNLVIALFSDEDKTCNPYYPAENQD